MILKYVGLMQSPFILCSDNVSKEQKIKERTSIEEDRVVIIDFLEWKKNHKRHLAENCKGGIIHVIG